jgi:hypothetical protein
MVEACDRSVDDTTGCGRAHLRRCCDASVRFRFRALRWWGCYFSILLGYRRAVGLQHVFQSWTADGLRQEEVHAGVEALFDVLLFCVL